MSEQAVKKIVVAGGGFAGINLIKQLSKDKRFHITLIDKNNYNFFPPLLYQVATAFIEPSNISYPFRRMFQQKTNIRFHMGSLLRVNPAANTVETDTGTLEYDYLVLAMGSESNYFGIEGIRKNAFPMKTIDDALNLRNYLLLNLEKAVRENDIAEKQKRLAVVIAGGGPTGVEVAGMLSELRRYIAKKEYPEIKHLESPIYLIEAAPVLLGTMSKKSQQEASNILNKLGVHVILNTAVKDYTDGKVLLADGTTIDTSVMIWTSGVIAKEVPGLPETSIGRGRRIQVDEYNKVQDTTNIYALGDICLQLTDKNFPKGHPQVAQVGIQHGITLAKNLTRMLDQQSLKPFTYYDKGSLAIIAKYKAVADLPKVFFKGFIAWFIWLFAHIIPLVGFRNKVKLAFSWFWSFITNNPTLRLIIRPRKEDVKG